MFGFSHVCSQIVTRVFTETVLSVQIDKNLIEAIETQLELEVTYESSQKSARSIKLSSQRNKGSHTVSALDTGEGEWNRRTHFCECR